MSAQRRPLNARPTTARTQRLTGSAAHGPTGPQESDLVTEPAREDGRRREDRTTNEHILSRIDTTRPHSARIWNYWLEGKDYYVVDRDAGEQIRQLHPGIGAYAQADRLFLGRAVRHLTGNLGVRQFLDIGTGLPTADNTHEVAQRVAPESRIVYVDNDPLVLAHARALLTSTPEGR